VWAFAWIAFARVVLFTFLSLAVVKPTTEAVVPAPDGGYPGFNTAEGQNALFSLNTSARVANTAVAGLRSRATWTVFYTALGAGTLVLNSADENAAIGAAALLLNNTGFQNTAVGVATFLNRQRKTTLRRTIRADQRDVAQRVSQRTSQKRATRDNDRRVKERNC
jgi:hypothetical protein